MCFVGTSEARNAGECLGEHDGDGDSDVSEHPAGCLSRGCGPIAERNDSASEEVGMAKVETVPLYPLHSFYAQERDHHGTFMSQNENTENATDRRLSCRTDFELMALRDAALEFARLCDAAYEGRAI